MRDGLAALWVERSERNVSIDNVARIAGGLKIKSYRRRSFHHPRPAAAALACVSAPWMLLDDSVK
jgi:hypothetical protein